MLFWILGALIVLAGLAAAAWCLFADRALGKKRCPKCWYSMEGASGLTCPECGKTVKSERGLLRTRRRWGRAGLGLFVIVVGSALAATPMVMRWSTLARLPRPVLMVLVRFEQTAGGPAFAEAQARAFHGSRLLMPDFTGWSDWEASWFAVATANALQAQSMVTGVADWRAERWSGDSGELLPGTRVVSLESKLARTLFALGERGSAAVPPLLTMYNSAASSETTLLNIFPMIGRGSNPVIAAVSGRLTHVGGASDGERIECLVWLVQTPKQRRELVDVLERLKDALAPSDRAEALAALVDLHGVSGDERVARTAETASQDKER